ncbi:hypothetical protein J6590_097487 [Homalodisca vitripennis]|nr:hypothetical protein J6590_097487 [Homalodisca vitripennis]
MTEWNSLNQFTGSDSERRREVIRISDTLPFSPIWSTNHQGADLAPSVAILHLVLCTGSAAIRPRYIPRSAHCRTTYVRQEAILSTSSSVPAQLRSGPGTSRDQVTIARPMSGRGHPPPRPLYRLSCNPAPVHSAIRSLSHDLSPVVAVFLLFFRPDSGLALLSWHIPRLDDFCILAPTILEKRA